jgi:hypothetical protein
MSRFPTHACYLYTGGMDESLFTMSATDIRQYGYTHGYAQMMFGGSADDYVSARCLILNRLFAGFPLYSQSVEKMLKAIIHLETEKSTTLKRADKHNPYLLKEELQRHKDYDLNKFDVVLQRLYGHFQQRYHDNPNKSSSMGSKELDEFDELWMYMFDAIPFPLQIKYRLSFTHHLFNPNAKKWWPQYFRWATLGNKAIAPRLKDMEKRHLAVEKHYIESAQKLSKPQA